MDALLRRALEPVLRDIRLTGARAPRIEDREWTDEPSAMMWSDDGTGWGLSVLRAESDVERVVRAADNVQEWLLEDRWSHGEPTNWPPCPPHPSTHPLTPAVRDATPRWVCPADGSVVAVIGGLVL